MGLDIALGTLVLVAAVRGWFKGFLLQAIRLAGLVLGVYAADPVRDQLKPQVIGHLPTIRPELMDRILWWASAVASYVLLVGVATLAVKLYRRQTYGVLEEPRRGDQFAGSLLGAAKAAVVAAFLLAGVEKLALTHLKPLPWAVRQVETSRLMTLNARFQPVPRIWAAAPVQHFVRHVQQMGLSRPSETSEPAEPPTESAAAPATAPDAAPAPAPAAPVPPVRTASRAPELQWTATAARPNDSNLDPEVREAVEAIERKLARNRP